MINTGGKKRSHVPVFNVLLLSPSFTKQSHLLAVSVNYDYNVSGTS